MREFTRRAPRPGEGNRTRCPTAPRSHYRRASGTSLLADLYPTRRPQATAALSSRRGVLWTCSLSGHYPRLSSWLERLRLARSPPGKRQQGRPLIRQSSAACCETLPGATATLVSAVPRGSRQRLSGVRGLDRERDSPVMVRSLSARTGYANSGRLLGSLMRAKSRPSSEWRNPGQTEWQGNAHIDVVP